MDSPASNATAPTGPQAVGINNNTLMTHNLGDINDHPPMVVQQVLSNFFNAIGGLNAPIPALASPLQNPSVAGTGAGGSLGAGVQTVINDNPNVGITSNTVTQGPTQSTPSLLWPTAVTGVASANQLTPNPSNIEEEAASMESHTAVDSPPNASPGEVNALAGSQNLDINDTSGSNFAAPQHAPGGTVGAMMDQEYSGSSNSNPTPNSHPNAALNTIPIITAPTTSAATPGVRSTRIVDPTLNLIRFCRQKKIYLDIGLCAMKQQCFTVRAHDNASVAQNLLAAVGGIAGFAPLQRGQVVLAEKRPAKRECCQEECKLVEVG